MSFKTYTRRRPLSPSNARSETAGNRQRASIWPVVASPCEPGDCCAA